jgi:DNA polymerase elongation subunit (family B)
LSVSKARIWLIYQNIFIEQTTEGPLVHLFDDQLGHRIFAYKDFDYAYKLDRHGSRTSLHGHRVKKVKRWKRDDPMILESDLPKETRILTDLYLDSDEPSKGHRSLVYDIEISSKGGLPRIDTADKEITAISLEDKTTGEEYSFVLDEDGQLDDFDFENVIIMPCTSEEELLSSFLDTWEEINPTIITGWNIDYFDTPYLFRRIDNVLGHEEAIRLSPVGLIKFSERRRKWQIAGISALDYLDLYKKFTYTEQPNYRLGTIGTIEVGMGKVEYEGSLDRLKEEDPEKFLRYNLRDVRIVSALDKKMKLIELVRGICTIGHVPYEDYTMSSRWLEGALVTDLHRKGIVVPNRPPSAQEDMDNREDSGEKGFAGAYVKAPNPGLYDWVFSLDLQSLYPSIVMSLNISPETKVGKVLNWSTEGYVLKQVQSYEIEDEDGKVVSLPRKNFISFMTDAKLNISSNGILYRTDKVGLLSETLDRWFNERLEYKAKMKDAANSGNEEEQEYWSRRQHIQKIFLNSLYGVLGLPIFRFYDVDNALAVTATGQDVIKTSAKFVNNKYVGVTKKEKDYCIYIDTDSLYFSSLDYFSDVPEGGIKKATIELARKMESELNEFYGPMAQRLFFIREGHRFVIKGETIAKSAFWVQKKRYALKKVYDLETDQDIDKVTVKGLDVVRSSFPTAFREFMKEVLTDILGHCQQDDLDKKILEFRRTLPSRPIPDVARNTAVKDVEKWVQDGQMFGVYKKGAPAHVKAAINHNLLLEHFNIQHTKKAIENGEKIKWVYLKDNPMKIQALAFFGDSTDARPIAKMVRDYIDYDRLFEKEFSHKLQDFYTALKWGLIPTEVNQKAEEFFAL